MTVNEHVTVFAGLPVVGFGAGVPLPADPGGVAWRLSAEYDTTSAEFTALVGEFLAAVDPGTVTALIVGQWGQAYETPAPVELLADLASTLTGLTAIFLGEMTFEECEISWIRQGDVTPLLDAYPRLEVLRVRGAEGLMLEPVRHTALRELAFESGGLPGAVARAVGECDLPALEHLELWLGTPDYGGDTSVDDLSLILSGTRLPALRELGLRDAQIADEVAAALAEAPVVGRLDVLDLSLGTLSDTGAAALLAGQPLTHLRRLDLHHHYVGTELAARFAAELNGVAVDLSDPRQATDFGGRYVAVAE